MKKVSIYVKSGKRAATAYYRFYKYFERLESDTLYRKMIPDNIYDRVMPISKHSKLFQIVIFIYIYLRVLRQLVADMFRHPDLVVISRRLLNRVLPPSFKFLLWSLKKRGTKIVWDFDDQIIACREVTPHGFQWMSDFSDVIIVASPVLRDLVSSEYWDKVLFLPTTDNEPYEQYNEKVKKKRQHSFDKQIRLIWLATSVSLPFLREILPAIEKVGESISSCGKSLLLSVVCNYPMEYTSKSFVLENIKWERDVALQKLLEAHVGLMPLKDTPVTRGKGGFKLIQYMSGALPVVGTAIGINVDIINGHNGKSVQELDTEEWYRSIMDIVGDKSRWENYSDAALKTWEKNYNFDKNLLSWKQILENK